MLEVRARWTWDADAQTLRLDVEQRQPGLSYRMPIEVSLEVGGEAGPHLEKIEISDRRESFSIPLEHEPQSVVLDPRTVVLMDADIARFESR